MPEFLVAIDIELPFDLEPDVVASLTAAERERGLELVAQGSILRIWRIPGRTANIGVWVADDATDLHRKLTSLPLCPYMDIRVTALAIHPLEAP